MSRAMVIRLFVGSLFALAASLVLLVVAGVLAVADGSFVMDGPDVVGYEWTPLSWVTVGLAGLAALAAVGALAAQFVAWIGALVTTAQLADKTWFVVLLVVGLLGAGFLAMLAYVVAGPDDPVPATAVRRPTAPVPRPTPPRHA